MFSGAVAMSRVPNARVPHKSAPIQHSHTASLTQARSESGGIVSERRFHGLISGNTGAAISYFHLLRGVFSAGTMPGSSIVITLLAP
jgi:hypothetical protein